MQGEYYIVSILLEALSYITGIGPAGIPAPGLLLIFEGWVRRYVGGFGFRGC